MVPRISSTNLAKLFSKRTFWKSLKARNLIAQLAAIPSMASLLLAEDDTTTAEVSTAVHASSHLITNAPETPTAVSSPAAIHHAPIHVYKPAVPAQPPPPEFAQPTPPLAKSAPAAAHARKPASRPSTSHASPHDNTSDSPWCITYSPYTASGNCKSSSAISSDVASIASKGFSSIRIYSTDCNGLPIIAAAAAAHNLNLVLGVYIPAEGIPAARPQIQEIIEWATSSSSSSSPPQTTTDSWQNIEMIVIGNEAIFNAHCSAASLAAFITEARRAFRAAGYPGPITTAEPLAILSRFPHTLCPVSDVLAANIHPFFNPDVLAHQAGAFVAAQLALLRDVCPGGEEKEAYVLETGWPSRGAPNGRAVPG
ncbi:MAG: hypothetical protein Q9206_006696, partial [Seirophora lacunosa]